MRTFSKNYSLNFTGGYVEMSPNSIYDLGRSLTIGVWLKPKGVAAESVVLSHGPLTYTLKLQNNVMAFVYGQTAFTGQTALAADKWSYMSVAFDETTKALNFYINGNLDSSHTISTVIINNPAALYFGSSESQSQNQTNFVGEMASVALWRAYHTAWMIKQDYGSPVDTVDNTLIGYWAMEDGSGVQVTDSSANALVGTINGNVAWNALTTPITAQEPSGSLRVNTSVGRLSTLTTTAPTTSLPDSGRNGEATKFLNKVKAYTQKKIADQKLQNNATIDAAKKAAADKVKNAHQLAVKTLNSTRFDKIYFLYKSKIYSVDPKGAIAEFKAYSDQVTSKTVTAKDKWQSTGITAQASDKVKIEYKSGTWSIIPNENVTAAGSSITAGSGYVLPGVKEGSLIGKIGNNSPFHIGTGATAPTSQTGILQLITNDDIDQSHGDGFADNSGSINVDITHLTPIEINALDIVIHQSTDDQRIFWSSGVAPFTFYSAKLDGSEFRQVGQTHATPITSLALDEANQVVYHIVGAGEIYQVKYDGSSHQKLLDITGPTKDSYWQIEVDPVNQKIYWTNDYSIWRADLNGQNAELIISNHDAPFPIDIAVDGENNKLYWVDKQLEMVRRANLDGTQIEDLYAAKKPARGLTYDVPVNSQLKPDVYWVQTETSITAQTPGIVGVWPMNKGTGLEITNSIEPLHKLTMGPVEREYLNLPPNMAYPHYGLQFSGQDYLAIPNTLIDGLSNNSFTVEMWVKLNEIPENGDVGLIAMRNYSQNKCLHLLVRRQKPHLGFYGNDTYGSTTLEVGKWVHLAFRYDIEKQEQTIFVNGKQDAQGSNRSPLQAVSGSITCFGDYRSNWFNGSIADVRIITQAKSQEEIQADMLNYGTSDIITGLDLAPTWQHRESPPILEPHNYSPLFNGLSDYIKMGDPSHLGPVDSSFTVECWVKPAVSSGTLPVLGNDSTIATSPLNLALKNGKPYIKMGTQTLSGNTAIPTDEWSHVAWRFDKDQAEATLFVNGVTMASGTNFAPHTGTGEMYVGRADFWTLFNGYISELRIWRVARTDDDIRSNFRAYYESYAVRGQVDGSDEPEHLFEIPAEGGINLASKQIAELEERLIQAKARKDAKAKAARDIAAAHAAYDSQVSAKHQEFQEIQTQKTNQINNKKAELASQRAANRTKLRQSQANASQRIDKARTSAQQQRTSAQTEAARRKDDASAKAATMKAKARADHKAAQTEYDKQKSR